MKVVRTVRPTFDAISIPEIKEHLGIIGPEHDARLALIASAASDWIEKRCGVVVAESTYVGYLDDLSSNSIIFPRWPVKSVTSFQYLDDNNAAAILAGSDFVLVGTSVPAFVAPAYGLSWPSTTQFYNGVQITFRAGFSDADDVPDDVRVAFLMICAHLFENRGEDAGGEPEFPAHAESLLSDYRIQFHP